LSCVAEALYLNKYYISKLFSSTLNMSFVDFVANQRIHTVCERLTAESEPITRIAYECGFRNLSNFNRIFRHLTGMTPREYRNAYSSKR
ncbi:MAG: helix-turn-helix transcriptional regulator, partial [Clostridia bacterium]|nr:helix-turn-helix transcriptional regulator [Clostridia bacterium]